MMRKFAFLFFFQILFSQEATVNLINDSPFLLRVSIQSANGDYLGGARLEPGEFRKWTTVFKPTDLDVPNTPVDSLTPFTVIFRCEEGDFYSVCTDASPGALVRATICPGAHYCNPKAKEPNCPPCEQNRDETP